MRPKKKVLVCGIDPDETGRLGYVLWAREYAPVIAGNAEQAVRALAEHDIECAIAVGFRGVSWAEEIVVAMLNACPGLPTLLLAPAEQVWVTKAAVMADPRDMARVMEVVKVLCARRRGPKTAGARYSLANIDLVSSKLHRVG